jgi:hypothetical protein
MSVSIKLLFKSGGLRVYNSNCALILVCVKFVCVCVRVRVLVVWEWFVSPCSCLVSLSWPALLLVRLSRLQAHLFSVLSLI